MSKFVQLWLVLVLAPACLEAQTTAVTNSNNGTANTVPAYTGSATLGNSVITQSGNNIGINLGAGNTPDATLVISGGNGAHDGIGDVVTAIEGNSTTGPQLWMGNTPGGVYDGHEWSLMASGSSNVLLGSGSAGKFALIDRTYGIPRFVIDGAGNFGLGTASPTSAFHLYSGDMTIGSYNLNFPTPPSGSSSINRLSNVSLLRETLGDGSGRFNIYWNAYNDSNGNQYYVANEPAVKWDIGNTSGSGGTSLYVAPSSSSAGLVNWNTVFSADPSGNTTLANNALYLKAGANVGIGTSSPNSNYKLDVEGGSVNSSGGYCIGGNCITAWPTAASTNTWTGTQTFNNTINFPGSGIWNSSGNVGIGTRSPSVNLHIDSSSAGQTGVYVENDGATNTTGSSFPYLALLQEGTSAYGISGWANAGVIETSGTGGLVLDSYGPNGGPILFQMDRSTQVTITHSGNVGIGTTNPQAKLEVNGGLRFTADASGTAQTTAWTGVLCGGDYAEAVDPADKKESYRPGDVLVITETDKGDIQKSSEPYSTMVAGVFATKPGVVGRRQTMPDTGEDIPMAMVGIVPTKVTAENGPIHRGDLLVSSSQPGYAMKGTDRTRMLGAVIGKAMGSLGAGTGVIEVLVTLQ